MRLPVALTDLVHYLDARLDIARVADDPDAHNGLQVENPGAVSRIAAAVDATYGSIKAAADIGADFLLVHHGLFWDGGVPLVGRRYRRLGALMDGQVALYAAHLPLDVHPELGNNVLLLRALGLEPKGRFGIYRETEIGWWAEADQSRESLADAVRGAVGRQVFVMPFGPAQVRRVGVVTGGGGSLIAEAKAAGLDAYVTGEGPHYTYFDAEELGITVIYAGHYATETFGVKAAASEAAERFNLPWHFVDRPTGL